MYLPDIQVQMCDRPWDTSYHPLGRGHGVKAECGRCLVKYATTPTQSGKGT